MKPPFPWFGGKSAIAPEVWRRFGRVRNLVDPFCGSLAILLNRPEPWDGLETVNDADGFICNFWRATQSAPDEVAHWCDWPVIENDLHARHIWLRGQSAGLVARLEGDPHYCDSKIAGWWCWGICCWIGGGWCGPGGDGPWSVVNGELIKSDAGRGVNRKRPHLGNAGVGVNRQRPHLGNAGMGVNRNQDLVAYFAELAARLARVRICCGDWSRVCGDTPTIKRGLTAVFLDPPYSAEAGRDNRLYAQESLTVAHDVRRWAIERGDDPLMRIALCGYEGEHEMPGSWDCWAWKARGGYGNLGNGDGVANTHRERVWFSPHCVSAKQLYPLFAD